MFWDTIGDVREGSDEEHSIWSGGSKIKDLAQCGWGEKKMKKKEKRENDKIWNVRKCEILEIENIDIIDFYYFIKC